MKFTVVADHAIDLADGSVHGPSTVVNLSSQDIVDPHNRMLIAEGILFAHSKRGQEVIDEAQAEVEKADRAAAEQAAEEARLRAERAKEGGGN